MNSDQIRKQSDNAYNQWKVQWREHATQHSKLPMKSIAHFENSGIGKAVLCIANGYSFEANLETIKKYQKNVDILVCDKTLGHCLDNGITPTYLVLCDANVSYEKYMEPWKDKLKDTIIFSNVCANPKWTHNGNWKDKYFFVNMDVIDSHKEFSRLSGCTNFIPAGTNVSNAMVVFLTQSTNEGRRNFFGYDKTLLIGFDYSWTLDGKYYAFDKDGNGKTNYMRHVAVVNQANNHAYTSNNLLFSVKWLEKYISTFKLPVVNCTKQSLLTTKHFGNLEEQMQYKYKTHDRMNVQKFIQERDHYLRALQFAESKLHEIGKDHFYSYLATV